ncbi:MAG: DUF3140 domain-containing protein [Terricaulis sp.]
MSALDDWGRAFRELVNLNAAELAAWLKSPESESVGWRAPGMNDSVGRASGRAIVAILRTPSEKLTEAQLRHMRKVVGFIRRHRAQRPGGDISRTRWRYSLMNWGHDPMKSDPI